MIEEQEMIDIEKRDLLDAVAALRSSGHRLVQICATTCADHYEMNYSFDKDLRFKNLRFPVRPGDTVSSVSRIYTSAFLYENEIHDLFGIGVENMVLDYRGTLYQTATPAPFGLHSSPQETANDDAPGGSK
jgi:ech hydrogenase subunit D